MKTQIVLLSLVAICLALPASAALVDLYEFEGNGVDSQGGDASGTVGSSVTFGAGPIGQAMYNVATVNGGSDTDRVLGCILVPQANAFDPGSGSFSIAFWVKRNNTGDTDWVDGVLDASGGGEGYLLNFQDTSALRLRLDDSGDGSIVLSQNTLLTDTVNWHHYAVVVNRTTSTARIYFDGVDDGSIGFSLTGTTSPGQDLEIGNNYTELLDGGLDDLRMFDHALTQAEVSALVPEPATMSLLALGGVAMLKRRKK